MDAFCWLNQIVKDQCQASGIRLQASVHLLKPDS
jgi:hypothetical protein